MSSTPGWYPQPDGQERYYDGDNWTDQVRAPQPAGAPGPLPAQPPPADKKGGKLKWLLIPLIGILLCCGGAAVLMGGDDDTDSTGTSTSTSTSDTTTSESPSSSPAESEAEEPAPEETEEPAAEEEPEMTAGQANALRSAENYIDLMPFSRQGLIDQLSSDAGDGYSVEDATFAADNVEVDWNEEAAEAAKNYLELTGFSRSGLIDQLTSEAGDGFTREQAEYGVTKAGL